MCVSCTADCACIGTYTVLAAYVCGCVLQCSWCHAQRARHCAGVLKSVLPFHKLRSCWHFAPQPLGLTLKGVTNDPTDAGVDVLRTVTLPLLKRLGVDDNGLELKVCAWQLHLLSSLIHYGRHYNCHVLERTCHSACIATSLVLPSQGIVEL